MHGLDVVRGRLAGGEEDDFVEEACVGELAVEGYVIIILSSCAGIVRATANGKESETNRRQIL